VTPNWAFFVGGKKALKKKKRERERQTEYENVVE